MTLTNFQDPKGKGRLYLEPRTKKTIDSSGSCEVTEGSQRLGCRYIDGDD